jgi:hypothetical protein
MEGHFNGPEFSGMSQNMVNIMKRYNNYGVITDS